MVGAKMSTTMERLESYIEGRRSVRKSAYKMRGISPNEETQI